MSQLLDLTGLGRSRSPRTTGAICRAARSAIELSTLAVSALIEEAELTPKPALVDRRGNGAHHDLDLARLRRSAQSLQDGFAAIARAAAVEKPSLRLREQIGRIGRDMERRMLAATDGSNAHRGAIWALGLLVAAAARRGPRPKCGHALRPRRPRSHGCRTGLPPRPLSNGERARLRFGAAGARGEAQAAFPHAIRVGLPTLRAARDRGVPEDCARLDALMAIMASLDDTCLLHRGGLAALAGGEGGRPSRARRGRDGSAGRHGAPAPAACRTHGAVGLAGRQRRSAGCHPVSRSTGGRIAVRPLTIGVLSWKH